RRQDDAVRLRHVADDLRDRAVLVDAVDALGVDLARLAADVARVGEVDAALEVDGQVVGAVEPLALPLVREGADLAVPVGDLDAAIAAAHGAFAGDEPALRIEVEPVGPAARLAKLAGFAAGRVVLPDAIADVPEVH